MGRDNNIIYTVAAAGKSELAGKGRLRAVRRGAAAAARVEKSVERYYGDAKRFLLYTFYIYVYLVSERHTRQRGSIQ